MQLTLATIALAAATIASAQGVSGVVKPAGSPPAGCSTDYAGKFEVSVVLPSKKRDIAARQATTCAGDGTLVASLAGSVLTDAKGRIGAIVANRQFQFDGPPAQTGSIYTGGWSVCGNGSLALGPSAVFYECLSGNFYNLYDQAAGASCQQVLIDIIPCSGSGGASGPVSQPADGQPKASSAVSQIHDGQVQATSAVAKASQIGDGQVQASSAVAAPKPVSQFTDGQIQVTAKPTPVAQITDGQVQATGSPKAPVSQISDGQVQASASAQAPASKNTNAPVSQKSDGQVQATGASSVSKPSTSASTSSTPAQVTTSSASYTGVGAQLVAVVAALAAFALL